MGSVTNWAFLSYLSPLLFSLLIGRKLMNEALSKQMFLVEKRAELEFF